ncbi:MAG: group 1 truncated hemoglobin [Betaproteobacteria bacterium]|nr:group 1 truncated hemoglobin [Betaproteobacteria bacterium]
MADIEGAAQSGTATYQTERSTTMSATLYERLGGVERITTLAKDLVELHYTNPLLKTRFEQIKDRAKFERNVADFICAGTGGPQSYTGKDVLSAHRHMNIDERELVSAIDDAMTAMTKNGYGQAEKNDVLAILYSLKGDVVRV